MNPQEIMDASLNVRSALLALQKEILDYLKVIFEKESGRSVPPTEWLQVLMVSQRYEWLRELTSLIADIDLLTELQNINEQQAAIARAEVERLFFIAESDADFAKYYRQLMAAEAPFMLAQGLLKVATQKLPALTTNMSHEKALEARKAWQEEHKNQARIRRS